MTGAAGAGVGVGGVSLALALDDDFGDDLALTLSFFTEAGFLMEADGGGAFKSFTLLVLEEGDPLELRVEPTSRPTDLFRGLLLLLPALARCWRPLVDILAAGCGGVHPVVKNWKLFLKRTREREFE